MKLIANSPGAAKVAPAEKASEDRSDKPALLNECDTTLNRTKARSLASPW